MSSDFDRPMKCSYCPNPAVYFSIDKWLKVPAASACENDRCKGAALVYARHPAPFDDPELVVIKDYKEKEARERPRLTIVPLTLKAANDYVTTNHRHHKKVVGHKFSIGVVTGDGVLHGVCIVSRPIARHFDDGFTAEVTRTCTDGTPNANSALYGAAWRCAKAMGYRKIITYTQEGESGASLRGAGWTAVGERKARGSWAESSVKMKDKRDPVGNGGIARTLWEKT